MTSISFLMQCEIDTCFNPTGQAGITVKDESNDFIFCIKPLVPESDNHISMGSLVSVEKSFLATAEQADFVDSLIGRVIRPYGDSLATVPMLSGTREIIDAEGNLRDGETFWFEWLPSDLKGFVNSSFKKLNALFDMAIRRVRWSQNDEFPTPSVIDKATYWNVGKGIYYHVPQQASKFKSKAAGGLSSAEHELSVLAEVWQLGSVEPLAHELLIEAKILSKTTLRSALLMAASAVEVGVKTHIGRVAPMTDWLISNLPSPPIYKILRDFIPSIHKNSDAAQRLSQAKHLMKSCHSLFELRNRVTHSGAEVDYGELSLMLDAANDLLYTLDYLEGNLWTTEHVGHETRVAMNWPEPVNKRKHTRAIISVGPH